MSVLENTIENLIHLHLHYFKKANTVHEILWRGELLAEKPFYGKEFLHLNIIKHFSNQR